MQFFRTLIIGVLFFVTFIFTVSDSLAADEENSTSQNAFINIIMPVRGGEFWEHQNITPSKSFQNYHSLIKNRALPATWLLRFDALNDQSIVNELRKQSNHEVGLFMEVTPKLAEKAGVKYNESEKWHAAGSILITGYSPEDRQKLIDTYFNSFRELFGYFPKSVGAWWIDGASLEYMNKKYGVIANLMVADQLSTDQYEVWGQYWSTPFYPSKYNPSQPAQDINNKTNTVTLQWAARDPYRGYGGRVEESTRSVQANDYLLHPGLDINYFKYLLDVFVKNNINPFGQVSIGIENDFVNPQYINEFALQLDEIKSRSESTQVNTMSEFASWYKKTFPDLSPTKLIYAKEYENPSLQVVWYQSVVYRAGIFDTNEGLFLKDLRSYSDMMKEPCLEKSCEELHLSKTTSRALDYVAFGQQLVLEEMPVSDFRVFDSTIDPKIEFVNDLGIPKEIVLQKNDLIIDKRIWAVPALIVDATSDKSSNFEVSGNQERAWPKVDFAYVIKSSIAFIASLIFLILLPGRLVSNLFKLNFYEDLILSSVFGISLFLIVTQAFSMFNLNLPALVLLFILGIMGLRVPLKSLEFQKKAIISFSILILSALSSVLPVVNSGLLYDYGVGFWGSNSHDAVWHLSIIQSLAQSFPPENFSYANVRLTNYNYFFDLIIARLTLIPYLDALSLYFRFWPIFISLLLGGSVWLLANKLKLNQLATSVLIFMTFFAGSWGWVITWFNRKEIAGESLFWSSQAISLHLNPSFALSLVFLVAIFIMLFKETSKKGLLVISILIVLLWGIKVQAGVLITIGLIIFSITQLFKNKNYFFVKLAIITIILSVSIVTFLYPNIRVLFEYSPLWLVESMLKPTGQLYLQQLVLMRDTYVFEKEFLKLYLVNIILVLIFILGNLGARFIALPLIIKTLFSSSITQLFSIIAIAGIVVSLLFIQKGNSKNIVEFLYYSLFIGSVFTALSFQYIYEHFRNKLRILVIAFSLFIIIIGSFTTYETIKHYFLNTASSAINNEELHALEVLKAQDQGLVLVVPFSINNQTFSNPVPLKFFTDSSYVSAFSNKPVFVADQENLGLVGIDYKRRIYAAKEYFKDPKSDWSKKFLREQGIKYLYISKHQEFSDENTDLEKILENSEVKIYKVN